MADAVKSAAATELVSKQQAGGKGAGLIGGALDRELVQQLFKKWLRSDDKDEVSNAFSVMRWHRTGKCRPADTHMLLTLGRVVHHPNIRTLIVSDGGRLRSSVLSTENLSSV